jgi:hypothetical protein
LGPDASVQNVWLLACPIGTEFRTDMIGLGNLWVLIWISALGWQGKN